MNGYSEHRFVLWQCSPTTETRGKKKEESGCMNWSVRKTKKAMRSNLKMQMICVNCTNRPRKDEATVWVYGTREDANAECERRNTLSEPLSPNLTVIIGGEDKGVEV